MQGPNKEWLMHMATIEDGRSVSVGGMAVDAGCYSAPDPRSWFQKLRDRAFPAKHCLAPDAPSGFKDCIHGHAVTRFSWLDRMRVLLSGVVVTSWVTVTENEIGQSVTSAECYVGTPKDAAR